MRREGAITAHLAAMPASCIIAGVAEVCCGSDLIPDYWLDIETRSAPSPSGQLPNDGGVPKSIPLLLDLQAPPSSSEVDGSDRDVLWPRK